MGMNIETVTSAPPKEISPSGMKVIWREIRKDKMAMISLVILGLVLIAVYSAALFIDKEEVARVNVFAIYMDPSSAYWLGTDYGGRDVFQQLIIGTRNSFSISLGITVLTAIIGLSAGLIAGYFGGWTDNIIMRVIDFVITLPQMMFIIVLVTIIPKFTVTTFILIMTLFLWTGKARLIRSKVLSERELDYVHASQTLGTPHWKIIL